MISVLSQVSESASKNQIEIIVSTLFEKLDDNIDRGIQNAAIKTLGLLIDHIPQRETGILFSRLIDLMISNICTDELSTLQIPFKSDYEHLICILNKLARRALVEQINEMLMLLVFGCINWYTYNLQKLIKELNSM